MDRSTIWHRSLTLAVWGGAGFWVANFLISLTPLAADYRAALSISYPQMLLEALVGGLLIGVGVGYCLVRFHDRIPTRTSLSKSLVLGAIALLVVTMLIEVPGKFLTATDDAVYYLFIGTLFNAVRISALAVVIGVLHGRMNDRRER